MRRTFFLAASLLTALASAIASAAAVQSNPPAEVAASQNGGGILPADRNASANWRRAGMLSVGGIPVRKTICATVSPKGDGADDTGDINRAIRNCPVGHVVSLGAGTFTIAEGNYVLVDKGITLRGAGPHSTILQRTNGARTGSYIPGPTPSPIIIVGPQRWNNGKTAIALTADAAAGASSVRVTSAAGFSVGQIVLLDEASGAAWQTDPQGRGQIWASSDFRVVWQKHNPSRGNDDFTSTTYPYTSGSAGCWFSNCDRPTNEIKQISAISGDTITFNSPITISYRVSHQARLSRWRTPHTQEAGVENMSLSGGDDGNLRFEWAAYSWAKNVEDSSWLGEGIAIDNSFRVQLEEFYVHDAVWPVPGGGGYAISLSSGSSEVLIENGISIRANKVMVVRSCGAGSVVAYNYMDDGYISGQEYWQEIGLNASHMVGSHHVLFEGNYSFNIDSDDTHGNSIYLTFFRNCATGYRRAFNNVLNHKILVDDINDEPGRNGPLRAAGAMAYSYWMSWVGNVLGTAGHTSGWAYSGGPRGNPSIFMLGWDDQPPYPTDAKVSKTAIRHGELRLSQETRGVGPEHQQPYPAGLAVPEQEAGLLQCGARVCLAVGRPHRLAAALHAAGKGALRRRDAVRATLTRSRPLAAGALARVEPIPLVRRIATVSSRLPGPHPTLL